MAPRHNIAYKVAPRSFKLIVIAIRADEFFKPIDAVGISTCDYPVGIAIEKIADKSLFC